MTDKQELRSRTEAAIETIRPYLVTDGGDVQIVEITDDNIVKIELLGACETCPMSPMTMKNGIEEAIKKFVPEIKKVVAINITEPQV
jgi:Fe-S cluster biogenesis protein NfuA